MSYPQITILFLCHPVIELMIHGIQNFPTAVIIALRSPLRHTT